MCACMGLPRGIPENNIVMHILNMRITMYGDKDLMITKQNIQIKMEYQTKHHQ